MKANYYFIGNIAIVKNEITKEEVEELIKKGAKSVIRILKIEGEKRVPKIEILAGSNDLKTYHKELGVTYVIDFSKVMFSRKNFKEKQRLINIVNKEDIVVDMFAGIGYFSLPIAKRVKKIYAIDINKDSIELLLEALSINKIKNIVPILSDNRKVMLNNIADRVIMGYIFETENFLTKAVEFCKNNAIIHFHRNFPRYLSLLEIKDQVSSWLEKINIIKDFEILSILKVKDYSPREIHYVVDIRVSK